MAFALVRVELMIQPHLGCSLKAEAEEQVGAATLLATLGSRRKRRGGQVLRLVFPD